MGRSIAFLTNKHRSGRDEDKVPDTWRDIKISNRALGKSDPPLSPLSHIGEGVGGVSDNIKSVMALPPKTAKFAQLKIDKIEVEVDKARVKARWHDQSEEEHKGSGKTLEELQKEEIEEREIVKGNKVNMNNIRVTELPGNKDVILPDDRSDSIEAGLAAFKQEILVVAKNYIENHCDSKGNIKESNLKPEMEQGLIELKTKIKNDNLIYGKTDKSDKAFLLTEEEYLKIAKPKVDQDKTISMEEVTKKENILNCHTYQICRVFGVCDA